MLFISSKINSLQFKKLAGLILIIAGSVIKSGRQDDIGVTESNIGTVAIVMGLIIGLISFLGCFGAANEKGLLLKSYFALLLIVIIMQIGIGIAAYVERDKVSLKKNACKKIFSSFSYK